MVNEAQILNIQKALIGFKSRAEKASNDVLVDTFVDSEPMLDILSTENNMVMYGRRGTGKTHALKYLEEIVKKNNRHNAIYLDMRSIGSNTSVYSDASKRLSDRATQLIHDVLQSVMSGLYEIAVDVIDDAPHRDAITIRLDDLQSSIGTVKVSGVLEVEQQKKLTEGSSKAAKAGLDFSGGPGFDISMGEDSNREMWDKTKSIGEGVLHIDFASVQASISGLLKVLGVDKFWILIDEWSEVPLDLQPYLADLLRRTILPVSDCVVKIAAIEHRSNFIISKIRGEYIGLELGADLTVALNLDDFLVFDSNEERSVQFFKNLIYKHYQNSDQFDASVLSPDDLIKILFTQQNVFAEYVRAVEGVPRDALHLGATMATKAFAQKISMQHVHQSARAWFQQDKSAVLRGNPDLDDVLTVVRQEVIGKRKARAFMFPSGVRDPDLEALFDARILHVLKRNVSSKDEPGIRYDVYKMDYGCYVDLLNTSSAPQFLFDVEPDLPANDILDVPKDDYRSIRRAILSPVQLDTLRSRSAAVRSRDV